MSLRKLLRKQRNEKEETVKTKRYKGHKAGKERAVNSNSVVCDTYKLEQWITKDLDLKIEDLEAALDIIGLKHPIRLSILNKEKKLVNCVTKDKKFTIEFCNRFWYIREIKLSDGIGTEYRLIIDEEYEPKHEITLSEKSIKKNGKYIISEYDCKMGYYRKSLIIDKNHKLIVKMCLKNIVTDSIINTRRILENDQRVEEYLLNLQNTTEVILICKKIRELTGSSLRCIEMSYVETIGTEDIKKETFGISGGSRMVYTIVEEGESFTVEVDGCWQYMSDNIEVSYNQEEDKYNCSVIGRNQLMNLKLSYIEEKVDELFKKVF